MGSDAAKTQAVESATRRLAVFASATFVSAFLLFQVQPLIGKFILPWFGGSPAVWTTCMVFFQIALFLGYAYAHAATRWLGSRQQAMVHLALLISAAACLPIAPDMSWKPEDAERPTWRILSLLTMTVGLPYFALSSTGPLLQAWFARSFPGRSPYRLYSLSNLGSLLALVTFPTVFEPRMGSIAQAKLWSVGFCLFAVLCGLCAWWAGRTTISEASSLNVDSIDSSVAPTLMKRALWLLLPAGSCLMLLATTNEVCQDVAPIPFLWVVPLTLYLLSFILCFDREGWYRRAVWAPLTAVLLFVAAGVIRIPDWLGVNWTTTQGLACYFGALFGVCMVCHGEVVRLRPAPKYLTEFYLMLSAGGALGGVFVTLAAPRVFTTHLEWPIGLVVAFVLVSALETMALAERLRHWKWVVLAGTLVLSLVALRLIIDWQFEFGQALFRARNFYGTVAVLEYIPKQSDEPPDENDEPYRFFVSGHINHGRQFTRAERRREPVTYYGIGTGAALAVRHFDTQPSSRVGLIGLGVGTIAAYARPGDVYRFYEINPAVEHVARHYFTYLADCKGQCDVVMGDARLVLDREPPQQFDVLVLDAFTGDAPPIHLLTKEAFEIYLKHLQPNGVIAAHVTNDYIDLALVVERLGREFQLHTTRIVTESDSDRLCFQADYVLLSRDKAMILAHPPQLLDERASTADVPVWTDQYSNLFQVLKRD